MWLRSSITLIIQYPYCRKCFDSGLYCVNTDTKKQHKHLATHNKATKQGQGTELQTPQAGSAPDKHSAETTLHSDLYCVHLPSSHFCISVQVGKMPCEKRFYLLPGEELRAKTRSKGKDCNCFHACRASLSVLSFLWSSKIYLLHITMTSHYSWPEHTEASCLHGGGHGKIYRHPNWFHTVKSKLVFWFFSQITWSFFCFLHHGTLPWPESIFLWCRVPWCRYLEQVEIAQETFHAYSAQVIISLKFQSFYRHKQTESGGVGRQKQRQWRASSHAVFTKGMQSLKQWGYK